MRKQTSDFKIKTLIYFTKQDLLKKNEIKDFLKHHSLHNVINNPRELADYLEEEARKYYLIEHKKAMVFDEVDQQDN